MSSLYPLLRRLAWLRHSDGPNPSVSLSTNFEYNSVDMPTGSFTASLYEVSGDWNPSPWVSITNQVQYGDQSELEGLFARLRWIVKPGNDVYLVYSHNWQYPSLLASPNERELITLSRGASIKANYTYRFQSTQTGSRAISWAGVIVLWSVTCRCQRWTEPWRQWLKRNLLIDWRRHGDRRQMPSAGRTS